MMLFVELQRYFINKGDMVKMRKIWYTWICGVVFVFQLFILMVVSVYASEVCGCVLESNKRA